MPKFSIIIPVYNVEEYIKKCLDSVFNQTYIDYEVIVVNDGTKDNSMDIVKKYDVKIINQKNMGLSEARNTGVKKATGDFLIFLDSDDYWEKDLLSKINKSLINNPDIVRFQIKEVNIDTKEENSFSEEPFNGLDGKQAFDKIVKYHFVENAWAYAIKREYYLKENFKFKAGAIHEDFGLIPLVIIKSNIVNSIEYIGYNYVQRSNSIMNSKNYEKEIKKTEDFIEHYKYLVREIDKTRIDSKIFKSFITNSLLIKITKLEKKDYKKYLKEVKDINVYNNILDDTIIHKIKKSIIKISPRLYYCLIKGD